MDRIAVFVDVAPHAKRVIEPMLGRHLPVTEWTVVGCPPRLSRHVGKWVSQASRTQWHRRWLQSLRTELEPLFAAHGVVVDWQLAQGRLEHVTTRLKGQHGVALRLLDACSVCPRCCGVDRSADALGIDPALRGKVSS